MPKQTTVASKAKVKKMTVSLPKHLVDFADELASELKTSRSKVVSSCLEEAEKRRKQARMEEGYRALAQEHAEFAELAAGIALEVLPKGD